MKLTQPEMQEISHLSKGDIEKIGSYDILMVEEGNWEDDGKYQHAQIIFQDISTQKFYAFWVCRTGSYYTEYDYQFLDANKELDEVIKVPKIIEVWEKRK